MNDSVSDNELLYGISRGDTKCLKLLMNRYSRYIVAVIMHVADGSLSFQDIEEICSDVFIKIWKSSSMIRPACDTLKPYLAATARNMTINRLKQLPAYSCVDISSIETASSANEMEAVGLRDTLQSAMNTLKQPDKELFERRYLLCEPVKKLAEKFGLNQNTVATKLSRARKTVAKLLKEGNETI